MSLTVPSRLKRYSGIFICFMGTSTLVAVPAVFLMLIALLMFDSLVGALAIYAGSYLVAGLWTLKILKDRDKCTA